MFVNETDTKAGTAGGMYSCAVTFVFSTLYQASKEKPGRVYLSDEANGTQDAAAGKPDVAVGTPDVAVDMTDVAVTSSCGVLQFPCLPSDVAW